MKQLTAYWFVFAVVLVTSCDHEVTTKPIQIKSDTLVYKNHTDSARYVGMNTCKACHQGIYNTFVETGMGHSFDIATRKKSSASFEHANVNDKLGNFNYQAFWQNDSLFIKEFRLNKKDTSFKRIEQVNFIIGSGQHTNSHLQNINGYIHQMPMTYFTQKKHWDLPPGFENGVNTRFTRKIGLECMSCHNGYPDFVLGSENKYTRVPLGIDCERCHGPGSIHVQERSSGSRIDTSKYIDYSIVNPSKLTIDLQFDICQRCHLQGNAILKEDKSFYDFKPGQKLSDIMTVFLPKYTTSKSEFIMASHADRLKQSACFIKTSEKILSKKTTLKPYKEGLTCITCHNPHVSVRNTNNNQFNLACISCHQVNSNVICTEKSVAKNYKNNSLRNSNCVNCHMPNSGSTDIPHVSVHDHYIKKPISNKEKASIKEFLGLIAVNEKNPDNHSKVKAYINQYEKFEKNTYYLDSALKLIPLHLKETKKTYLNELVQLYFIQKEYGKIIQLVTELQPETLINTILNKQSYSNTHAWTLYRIAESFVNKYQLTSAELFFKASVKLAPYQLDFRIKYATNLAQNKKVKNAIEELEFVIAENPKMVSAYTNLGYLYLVEGNISKCEQLYLQGEKLDPDNIPLLMNIGALYVNLKQSKKALNYFEHVLSINNQNAIAKEMIRNLKRM